MNKGEEENFGYCDLHEDSLSEDTYCWKGCWGCWHFSRGKDFPYVDVDEAAQELLVSPSTIRRWLKTGRLSGEVFSQGRPSYGLPSPRKYHITRESVAELRRKNQRRPQ